MVVKVIGLPAWASASQDEYHLNRLRTGVTSGNGKLTGVSVAGDSLFVAEWGYGRLFYYDLTNPLQPTFAGTHYAPYLIKAYADLDRGVVYMLSAYGSVSGLRSVPISILSPFLSTRYTSCPSCGYLKSLRAIDQGDLAIAGSGYVVYGGGRGLGSFTSWTRQPPRRCSTRPPTISAPTALAWPKEWGSPRAETMPSRRPGSSACRCTGFRGSRSRPAAGRARPPGARQSRIHQVRWALREQRPRPGQAGALGDGDKSSLGSDGLQHLGVGYVEEKPRRVELTQPKDRYRFRSLARPYDEPLDIGTQSKSSKVKSRWDAICAHLGARSSLIVSADPHSTAGSEVSSSSRREGNFPAFVSWMFSFLSLRFLTRHGTRLASHNSRSHSHFMVKSRRRTDVSGTSWGVRETETSSGQVWNSGCLRNRTRMLRAQVGSGVTAGRPSDARLVDRQRPRVATAGGRTRSAAPSTAGRSLL